MPGHIVSIKPGHDGTICALNDGRVLFSYEAEKGSFPRHSQVTVAGILEAFGMVDYVPDVVAVSGWHGVVGAAGREQGAGYLGVEGEAILDVETKFLGKSVRLFSSTHERSHVLCAYGLSPFENGRPVYVLVWEGSIGAFYEVNERVEIRKVGEVLGKPGYKYSFPYALANTVVSPTFDLTAAGKVMALAGFSSRSAMTDNERRTAQCILEHDRPALSQKAEFSWSTIHNAELESDAFKEFVGKFSDLIFDRFHRFARAKLERGRPLLIAGGCGLNCEWNTRWRDSGLFSDVFVPPCANDSGAAIGTAIDAQGHYWKHWKASWSVYSGQAFDLDVNIRALNDFEVRAFDAVAVASLLKAGKILAFVQGRCEIGPRALGNRSLLAEPFLADSHRRLNHIKHREMYRPIAPVCLENEAAVWFEGPVPSPYMLYFHRVKTPKLKAVTHVDGSARVQTVSREANPRLFELLSAFKELTGFGVLCNTSLNFEHKGFINSASDLLDYARAKELDGVVIDDLMLLRRDSAAPP
jgi:predicted NodU family carbamoyl transferase